MKFLFLLSLLALIVVVQVNGQCAYIPPTCLNAFNTAFLNAINSFRARHGSRPVSVSSYLTSSATSWACSAAARGSLGPNPTNYGVFGESIFGATNAMPFDVSSPSLCERYGTDAATKWYNQINFYSFVSNSCLMTGQCNDFTQMVWRGTTIVGLGLAFTTAPLASLSNRYLMVVTLHHLMKGNTPGQYATNVLKGGSVQSLVPTSATTTATTTKTTTTTPPPPPCQVLPASCKAAFESRLLELINERRSRHGSPPIVYTDNASWTTRTSSWACLNEVKAANLAKNPALLPNQQLFHKDVYLNPQVLTDDFCRNVAQNAINRWYYRANYMDYKTGKSWCPINQDLTEFTALVWKGVTKFSCSLQVSSVREKDFGYWHVVHCDLDVDANINKAELVLSNVGKPAPVVTTPAPPVTISNACFNAFHKSAIDTHNGYRTKHQAPPAVQFANATWSKIPIDYAQNLTNLKIFDHNPLLSRYNFGENIYAAFVPGLPNMADLNICAKYGKDAVDAWYSEIKSYGFDTGKSIDGGVIGHFTQTVWKTSTNVGCGLSVSGGRDSKGLYWIVVVCNYSPSGNFIGQYLKNVLPAV